MSRNRDCIVYVGNLPSDVREREVEDLFYKFGRIRNIDVKTTSRPPAFAFVEFEDPRDADDACRERDGYDFHGSRLRVELARGGRDAGRRGPNRMGPAPFGPSRRTEYRCIVTNLPLSCSWQDLKDHMRKAGDVTFAQVIKDGDSMVGMVDYATHEGLDYAVRKLDDTEFANPFDKGCYIRVKEDKADGGRGYGGRDRDRGYDRDRSRSPRRSHSRSPDPRRSISPGYRRSYSRSPSR